MEFTRILSIEELDPLVDEWNALLNESTTHVPFLRYEFLRTWWQNRGGGEWPRAELATVVARQDGRLVGIAPLFFTPNHEGKPALLLLGSIEISDYLDLISRPHDLQPFIDGLLSYLAGQSFPAWKTLDFYNLLDDSPTLPALEQAAKTLGWGVQVQRLQHSPYIPLPGDWDAYLAGIDKKQRHEIRRKLRRAEETDDSIRWYIVADPSEIEAASQAFLDLMAQDPDKARFLTPAMRTQMRQTIVCAFEHGCLQLAFLEVNGSKAAAYLNFDYLNRIWVYNSGLDRRFMEYSPGWVLLAYLLKWANDHQRTEFDLLRGNEDYKYRFGAVDRFVMRATLRPDDR